MKKVKKKKKLKTLRQLKKKAWKLISKYIRSHSADFAGWMTCYTCNRLTPWKQLQAGHFIHNKLDFDERNLRPQCIRCNHFLRGNLGIYAENLIATHGLDWVKKLRKDAQTKGNNYSRQELEEVIRKYD